MSHFASTGTSLSPKKGYKRGNISYPSDIAIDHLGNVWVVNRADLIAGKRVENVAELNAHGTPISPKRGYRGGGINIPTNIAIDGAGLIWVLDQGDTPAPCGQEAGYEITVLNQKGVPISPGFGYLVFSCGFFDDSYVDGLRGIVIDTSGNVWFNNGGFPGIGLLLELVGAATPVKTPLTGVPQRP